MTDAELMGRIRHSAGEKAGYKQLVRELGLGGGRERRLLLTQLERLTKSGQLVRLDREMWGIPKPVAAGAAAGGRTVHATRENLIAGRLDLHRDGYGFVRPNAGQTATKEDVFVPPNEIHSAMQGDQVLVEVEQGRDGRWQGRIVRVLERRNPTVVGVFHYSWRDREQSAHRGHWVAPFDDRMSQWVLIPEGEELPEPGAAWASPHRTLGDKLHAGEKQASLEGMVVDVEITAFPTATKPAVGRVIEVLGFAEEFGVDVEMMIRKHQLPRVFPDEVLDEARRVAHLDPAELARRVANGGDFRDRTIVTIDGETAKDFDDAIRVVEHEDGSWELEVHIADVAHYVQPASALDLEARLRGTSVYFPDRALPMLPHELSSGICSLKPNEDRLVLSCLMRLAPDGRVESYEICEGVIRSAARMTYTAVSKILAGDEETRAEYGALAPEFERMHKLALKMNKLREQRGSIDFDLPEPVIVFDEHGQMSGVTKAERTWANRLIEEFMLAANECVAAWLEGVGVPAIFRVHEKPEARRIVEFEELALSFGQSLGVGALPVKKFTPRAEKRDHRRDGRAQKSHEVVEEIHVTPMMYQKLSARIEGKPEERILSYLMLRSLKQARYSEVNDGHFALAAPAYTHFTSPIRRYPDLIVHRITKTLLGEGVDGAGEPSARVYGARRTAKPAPREANFDRLAITLIDEPPIPEAELAQIASETSQTERRAAEAERELMEWKKARFMEDRVGEEFAALVLNPTKYGMFVELKEMFIEGLVPIDSLRDDRYVFREGTHDIFGLRNGRRYHVGQHVNVVLDRVLIDERRLQFSIVEEGIPLTGRRPAPPTKKSKKRKLAEANAGRYYPGNKIAGKGKSKHKAKKHTARKGKRR